MSYSVCGSAYNYLRNFFTPSNSLSTHPVNVEEMEICYSKTPKSDQYNPVSISELSSNAQELILTVVYRGSPEDEITLFSDYKREDNTQNMYIYNLSHSLKKEYVQRTFKIRLDSCQFHRPLYIDFYTSTSRGENEITKKYYSDI